MPTLPPRTCSVCGGTYVPYVKRQKTCPKPACRSQRREMLRAQRDTARTMATDLTPEQVEAKLAALAAHRKATRSWLRIENAWAQRPGSELHHHADPALLGMEGALL